jgi:acetyl esterase/lipase
MMIRFTNSLVFAACAFGLAASLIAPPILAQRGGDRSGGADRPSRQCMAEIRDLCGQSFQSGRPDRAQVSACLQERADELSDECSDELRERIGERPAPGNQNAPPMQATQRADRAVIYGDHPRQQIDVYEPVDAVDDLPMVLFIHGGGWSAGSHKAAGSKPRHFNRANYYFASAGYRVLPDTPVEQQAEDIGAAVRALRGQARAIGFDPDRIVLMGHSSGAHLAALVGTDPKYAGSGFTAIRGVVLLDGAGYDIGANMTGAGPQIWQIYNTAFGSDPVRHAALSPVSHVGGADAPNWLALYAEERDIAQTQSQMLVAGLVAAGLNAEALAIPGTDHGRMNQELGTDAGAQQTQAVDAFLADLFD